jgi:hypothetical protein
MSIITLKPESKSYKCCEQVFKQIRVRIKPTDCTNFLSSKKKNFAIFTSRASQ